MRRYYNIEFLRILSVNNIHNSKVEFINKQIKKLKFNNIR